MVNPVEGTRDSGAKKREISGEKGGEGPGKLL